MHHFPVLAASLALFQPRANGASKAKVHPCSISFQRDGTPAWHKVYFCRMKRFGSLLLSLIAWVGLNAQVEFPAPSPLCKIEQRIGLTDVHIEYSRPGVKGRTIFGDLVPFGKMWRTGANASTKIEFSKDVVFGGQEVPAGTYALYTIPGEAEWTIVLHKNLSYWGTGGSDYDQAEDQCRFTVKPTRFAETVETFTILPNQIRDNSAVISLLWENTAIHLTLELGTMEEVEKDLKKVLNGPDGRTYYEAARFYLNAGDNMQEALDYINTAIEEKDYERFWVLRVKALIQAEMGQYAAAIETAKRSKALAEEAGNEDYVSMNDASIAEWSEQ